MASQALRLLPIVALAFALLAAVPGTAAASKHVTILNTVPARSVCSWKVVSNACVLNITLTPTTFQLAGPVSLAYDNYSAGRGRPKLVWSSSNLTTIPNTLSASGTYNSGMGTVDLGHIDVFNVTLDARGIKIQPKAGGEFGPVAPTHATVKATRVNGTVLGTYYSLPNYNYSVPTKDLANYMKLSGKYAASANGDVTLILHKTFKILFSNVVAGYGIPASTVPPNTYGEVVLHLEAVGHLPALAPAPAPSAVTSAATSTSSAGSFDQFEGE